jgi:hypothetical protein
MSRVIRPATVTLAAARRIRDPRWRWLTNSLTALYDEMGPGDQVAALNLVITDADFAEIIYVITPGEQEISRYLCPDPDTAADMFERNYVDLTPPASLDEGGPDLR